ncbi:MAG: CooT family nickel-binding protein [Anaerofustis sp.]
MCESIAYLLTEQGEEKIMDNVVYMVPSNDGVFLEDILGDQKVVDGILKEIKLLDHKILIQKR